MYSDPAVKKPRVPLIVEVNTRLSPIEAFEHFQNRRFSFFLDGGMDPENLGRYSFIGSDPFLVLSTRGKQGTLTQEHASARVTGDPFDVLRRLFEVYRLDTIRSPFPFIGGAVGYFSYDLCHFIEKLPRKAVDDLRLPECFFGFYDVILAFDNKEQKAYVVSAGFPELEENKRLARAAKRIDELKEILAEALTDPRPAFRAVPPAVKSNFTHEKYLETVAMARQYIIDGEIIQVNLSQRFEASISVSPWELYRRLRRINPAPFAAWLGFDEVSIISASPERFIRLGGGLVETRPIKGTRPRGKTPEEDLKLAAELLASAKDRAENIMIVDLERNDLGRVCQVGSVEVTELAALEAFPTVFHLTSTITGKLRGDKNGIDLLKAVFPGGSITGAPKIRAMEIIDELEPTCRSVYTGSIGYLSFNGDLDLNIAIRTFIVKDGKAYFQAGGGIVYDSDPEAEYGETLHKGRALFEALNLKM